MITAILTTAVVWCLLYGRLSVFALAPLCAGLGAAIFLLSRHSHSRFLVIDIFAQVSRLNSVSGTLKFWTVLGLTALCALSRSPVVGLTMAVVMTVLIVCLGGLRLRDYVRLLALPVSFLMLSALALLFEAAAERTGVIGIRIPGAWFIVSEAAQARTALVVGRAIGAVSCLYMLSLTTPMSELIGVLRRAHCPVVIIELMYLIYRYIFILMSMYHTMRDAARSRLGYIDYRAAVRTTGSLYANLLSRSYRQASRNFDAMESRCYDTEIRFLEHRERVTPAQLTAAAFIVFFALCLTILFW